MASKPLKPCRHPGCAELTREGWCDRHRPRDTGQRRISAAWHGWYALPVWTRELRPTQLLREPFCRECAKKGTRTRAAVVDHVIPFRGDWALFTDPGNFQSLCKFHHDQKTAREQAQSRREFRR